MGDEQTKDARDRSKMHPLLDGPPVDPNQLSGPQLQAEPERMQAMAAQAAQHIVSIKKFAEMREQEAAAKDATDEAKREEERRALAEMQAHKDAVEEQARRSAIDAAVNGQHQPRLERDLFANETAPRRTDAAADERRLNRSRS